MTRFLGAHTLVLLCWLAVATSAQADSSCAANTEPGLESARCLFEERAQLDLSPTRRTARLCAALLMLASPPFVGDKPCLRSQILNELGRFSEAARFAKECTEPTDRSLNPRQMEAQATEWAARYARVAFTFPAKAPEVLFATNLSDQTRELYRSVANEDQFRLEMPSNAPDAEQVEFTLPVGTWTLWLKWSDRSPAWSKKVEFTSHSSLRHFEFAVVTVEVDAAAPAIVTFESDGHVHEAALQSPDSQSSARRTYSATLPSPAEYRVVVTAANHDPARTTLLVSGPREHKLPEPIKLTAKPEPKAAEQPPKPVERTPVHTWLGSRRPLWLVVSAAGLVIASTAAIPWTSAHRKVDALRADCSAPSSCPDFADRRSQVDTLDIWTNVLLGAGSVAILGGLTAAYLPTSSATSSVAVLPSCTTSGCSVTQHWHF